MLEWGKSCFIKLWNNEVHKIIFNLTLVVLHKKKPEGTAVNCVLVFDVLYSIACTFSSTVIHRTFVIFLAIALSFLYLCFQQHVPQGCGSIIWSYNQALVSYYHLSFHSENRFISHCFNSCIEYTTKALLFQ